MIRHFYLKESVLVCEMMFEICICIPAKNFSFELGEKSVNLKMILIFSLCIIFSHTSRLDCLYLLTSRLDCL